VAIPSKQIGWDQKSNLLWNIAKQFEYITRIAGNIYIPSPVEPTSTTTTTAVPTTTTTSTTSGPFINIIIISNGSYADANGTYTRNSPSEGFTLIGGSGAIFFGGDAWYIFNTAIGNVARNTSTLGTGTWEPWAPGSSSGIIAEYIYSNTTTTTTSSSTSTTTTTTTTVAVNDWVFTGGNVSIFPANSNGYTLYTGDWTNFDDGQTSSTFLLGGDFYTNGTPDNTAYMSTNGYMIPFTYTGYNMNGNQGDLYLTPGQPLDDGDIQNFWYQNTVIGSRWKTSMLIYCGNYPFNERLTPYSYILNIYRDSQYQYLETVVKTNIRYSAGPMNDLQPPSTLTQVWQGNLTGTIWTYLGFGYVGDGSPTTTTTTTETPTTTTTTTVAPGDNFIATETNDELITENGNNLIMNYPLPTSEIITEDGNFVITENGDNLTTQ
jgi:hypothetical protein